MARGKRRSSKQSAGRSRDELERELEELRRENAELGLENRVLRQEIARYCPGVLPAKPKPKLMAALQAILGEWRSALGQERVFERARALAVGLLLNCGRNTVTGAIQAMGHAFEDWSATYRLFSEGRVDVSRLFRPLLRRSIERSSGPYVVLALDDTQLRKTGKKIPGCRLLRDPLSRKYHPNLVWAQRFVQASIVVPTGNVIGPARCIPVGFHLAPSVRKPRKSAPEEEWAAYRRAAREQTLSTQAAAFVRDRLTELRELPGGQERPVLVTVDGSMGNRGFLRGLPEGVEFLARVKGDAALYAPWEGTGRRIYGERLPTPAEMLRDDSEFKEVTAYGAGRLHVFRVKEVSPVLWRTPTGTRRLRLIAIAPLRYRPTANGKPQYRMPAYLLTSDLTTPTDVLLQAYVHRWEIEVNFRDEKTEIGVGEAQVWSEESVERAPAFAVAAYGALLLAAHEAYGPGRSLEYLPQPAWRAKPSKRASLADMRTQLRHEAWRSWLPPTSHSTSGDYEARGCPELTARLALSSRR